MPGRFSISLRQRTAFFTMTGIAEFLPIDTANGHFALCEHRVYQLEIPLTSQRFIKDNAHLARYHLTRRTPQAFKNVNVLRTALLLVISRIDSRYPVKRIEVSLNPAQVNRLWTRLKLFARHRAKASAQPASASGAANLHRYLHESICASLDAELT
jgi:hypothetical protein